jgi:hypothetical protein
MRFTLHEDPVTHKYALLGRTNSCMVTGYRFCRRIGGSIAERTPSQDCPNCSIGNSEGPTLNRSHPDTVTYADREHAKRNTESFEGTLPSWPSMPRSDLPIPRQVSPPYRTNPREVSPAGRTPQGILDSPDPLPR